MRRQVTREIVQPTGNATVSFPLRSVPFLFHPKNYVLSPFLNVQQRMWGLHQGKRGMCARGLAVCSRCRLVQHEIR